MEKLAEEGTGKLIRKGRAYVFIKKPAYEILPALEEYAISVNEYQQKYFAIKATDQATADGAAATACTVIAPLVDDTIHSQSMLDEQATAPVAIETGHGYGVNIVDKAVVSDLDNTVTIDNTVTSVPSSGQMFVDHVYGYPWFE